jgi:predicted enzyme related to lactoylglutathione lyase
MDVFDAGKMAVCQDPLGTFFSIWQPLEHIGAELVNEVGTFCWNELATPDLPRSSTFYRAVFGWELSADETPDGSEIYLVDGKVTCGAHTAGEGEFPAWSVWFTVADCDASAAQVIELGGAVHMPPTDMSFGRGAVVADPQGGVFGIAGLSSIAP